MVVYAPVLPDTNSHTTPVSLVVTSIATPLMPVTLTSIDPALTATIAPTTSVPLVASIHGPWFHEPKLNFLNQNIMKTSLTLLNIGYILLCLIYVT